MSSIQVIPQEKPQTENFGTFGNRKQYGSPHSLRLAQSDIGYLESKTLTNIDYFSGAKKGFVINIKLYWILDKILGRRIRKYKGYAFDKIKTSHKVKTHGFNEDRLDQFHSFLFYLQTKMLMLLDYSFAQIKLESFSRNIRSLTNSQILVSHTHNRAESSETQEEQTNVRNFKMIINHQKQLV